MNNNLKDIQISIKDLKKKIPTTDDDLIIQIHWDDDFTFEVHIPLNKKFKRR